MTADILVVDDEKNVADLFARALRRQGYDVECAYGGENAVKVLADNAYNLVITDLKMPRVDGIAVVKAVKAKHPETEVMIITGYGTVESAVQAMQQGVCDYVTKPLNLAELRQKVREILKRRELETEVEQLRGRLRAKESLGELIGSSTAMQGVYDLIEKMQQSDCNVFIWGESGTGKELVARAIHFGGPQKESPFVAINCNALPESILERELFGHAKGAYTGAHQAKEGYFQAAADGTLFLDEVSGLSPATQAKLLRAIEEKKIYRLGDPKPVNVSARVLAASNVDPLKAVEQGALREDLYFRLNVVSISLPPLRDRKEDIPILVSHFLKRFCERYGKPQMSVSADAMKMLYSNEWQGNVRELENTVEKAVVLAAEGSTEIESVGLPAAGGTPPVIPAGGGYAEAKKLAMQEFEMKSIRTAIENAQGSVTDAAAEMGIGRTALQRLLKKYGIRSRDFKSPG